ncbi:MAG: PAS domain S-box protein [Phycisphaerae bacterium]
MSQQGRSAEAAPPFAEPDRSDAASFETLFECAAVGIAQVGIDGRFIRVNQKLCEMLGYSRGELLSRTFQEITHPGDLPQNLFQYRRALRREIDRYTLEKRYLRKDGQTVWVSLSVALVRGADGQGRYFISVIEDITQRRQAEDALRISEQRYHALVEAMAEGVVLQTADGVIQSCNPAAERILGLPAEQILGRASKDPRWRTIHEDGTPWPGEVHPSMTTIATGELQDNVVIGVHRPDGALRWLSVSTRPLHLERHDRPDAVVVTFADITERRQAEQEIRAATQNYLQLIEHAPDAIVVHREGRFLFTNPAALRLHGVQRADQLVGRPVYDFIAAEFHEFVRERVRRVRESGQQSPLMELSILRADGQRVVVEATSVPTRFDGEDAVLTTLRDVTERRQLEQQLRQAQKMEAIGRLAGGVAHDFNNMLTVILGQVEAIGERGADPRELPAQLAPIRAAAQRGADLVARLLTFARKGSPRLRALTLNDLIAGLDGMLRRLLGERIELRTELSPQLRSVRADPAMLEQVVVNLAINARDAMPAGGVLTIETRNIPPTEPEGDVPACGPQVELAVRDAGVGMDSFVVARIFEPFFTTKEEHKGTGLGLATCHGIIRQFGGTITVESQPGAGSTFRICLPACDEPPVPAAMPALRSSRQGTEAILLVEDEPLIREVACGALRALGYTVLEAGSGAEALSVLRERGGPVELLVTDVVMPKMSGPELAADVRRQYPGARVLYLTGYAPDMLSQMLAAEASYRVLEKPFTMSRLSEVIRETLDAPCG